MSEQENEKLYLKGFNNGYALSDSEPDLVNQILTAENDWNIFIQGMRDGRKEYLQERNLDKLPLKLEFKITNQEKAFNYSYTIAKYDLKLSDQLVDISGGNASTLDAFQAGRNQYLSEPRKDKMLSFLKNDPFSKQDKKSPEKDKSKDIEPEL